MARGVGRREPAETLAVLQFVCKRVFGREFLITRQLEHMHSEEGHTVFTAAKRIQSRSGHDTFIFNC